MDDGKPKFRYIAIALAGLAFIYFVGSWNLPLEAGKCPDQPNHQKGATEHCLENQPATLGFLVRSFVADLWDIGATRHGFEFLIAIFTLLLASFTGTLWWTTRELLNTTPAIERAYISGGGPLETQIVSYQSVTPSAIAAAMGATSTTMVPITAPTGRFTLQINNHGKTPGNLFKFGIGFCEETAIPPTPSYVWRDWEDWIGPGHTK